MILIIEEFHAEWFYQNATFVETYTNNAVHTLFIIKKNCWYLDISWIYLIQTKIYLVIIKWVANKTFGHNKDDIWSEQRQHLVLTETSVGDYKDKTLEQCKELCNKNRLCKSFSFGKSGCYLKNKCIKTNDAQKPNSGYQTYYTKCNGNIIYVLIQWNESEISFISNYLTTIILKHPSFVIVSNSKRMQQSWEVWRRISMCTWCRHLGSRYVRPQWYTYKN